MNGHRINIAISGISLKVSDELKIELRKTIPNEFGINWINISDPNLDLLLINENLANSNMRCDSFKSLMIINKLSKFL